MPHDRSGGARPSAAHWRIALAIASTSVLLGADARADGPSKGDCVAASLAGQRARTAGRWTTAKDSFAVCGDPACPRLIRDDCAQWTQELITSIPTIVLGAQDSDGHDLRSVHVTIDGVLVSQGIDGQAVPIDPGSHVVRYEKADGSAVEQTFVMREGEKRRSVVMTFPARAPTVAPGPVQTPLPPPHEESSSPGRVNTIAGVATGAAGLAAVGLGVYFFTQQSSETTSLENMCAHGGCPAGSPIVSTVSSQVSTVNTNRALAGASFGIGVAAVGAGAYFLLARPLGHARGPAATALAGLTLAPAPARDGSFVGYAGTF